MGGFALGIRGIRRCCRGLCDGMEGGILVYIAVFFVVYVWVAWCGMCGEEVERVKG